MRARLSSHRFRRRAAWAGVAVAGGSAVVAGSVLIGNTGQRETTPLTTTPAWVYREPRAHRVTPAELHDLEQMTALFVRTAVARHDLDRAWEISAPELRAGLSRDEWTSGDNTVVPFPARRITAWALDYAYDNDVAFDVSLLSKPPYDTIGKTFMIELTRRPRASRWQVAYWAPKGVSSLDTSRAYRRAPPPPADLGRSSVPVGWLAASGAVLASGLLALAIFAGRTALRNRRAARRYADALGDYRSSSSPS